MSNRIPSVQYKGRPQNDRSRRDDLDFRNFVDIDADGRSQREQTDAQKLMKSLSSPIRHGGGPPSSAGSDVASMGSGSDLPPGWESARDAATGRQYYFNRRTNVSTWQHPSLTSLGNELSKPTSRAAPLQTKTEEEQLRDLSENIGRKAAQRFKTIRECFLFADLNHDGYLDQHEVRRLCRNFNVTADVADKFFKLLDLAGRGSVDVGVVKEYLGPYIEPGYRRPVPRERPRSAPSGERDYRNRAEIGRMHTSAVGIPRTGNMDELKRLSAFISGKVGQRFKNGEQILRYVNPDFDGKISRKEVRRLLRMLNLEQRFADRLFDLLDVEGNGKIEYSQLRAVVDPHSDGRIDSSVLRANIESPGRSDSNLYRANFEPHDSPRQVDRAYSSPANGYRQVDRGYSSSPANGYASHFQKPQTRTSSQQKAAWRKQVFEDEAALHEEARETRKKLQDVKRIIGEMEEFLEYKQARDAFRLLFGLMDEDKDGTLSRDEVRRFIKGFELNQSTADRCFDLLDRDGSGTVDYYEFMSFLRPVIQKGVRDRKASPPPMTPQQRVWSDFKDSANRGDRRRY